MNNMDVFEITKECETDSMIIFNVLLKTYSGEYQLEKLKGKIDNNKKTKKRFTILSIFEFLKLYKKNTHRLEFISKFRKEFFKEKKFDYLKFDPLEKRVMKHWLLITELLIQKKNV